MSTSKTSSTTQRSSDERAEEIKKSLREMARRLRNRWIEEDKALIIPADSLFGNASQVAIFDERVKAITKFLLKDASFNLAAKQYKHQLQILKQSPPYPVDVEIECHRTESQYLQVLAKELKVYYPDAMQKILNFLVPAHDEMDEKVVEVGEMENPFDEVLCVPIPYIVITQLVYESWPKEIRFMLPAEFMRWVSKDADKEEEDA